MRKLASIRQVKDIVSIPDADAIECATIDGWKCVVKKGDFKPGDYGVYFEIDSVLPPEPVFEFMKPRKYRVRTIKLRGQLSQGLLMPHELFKDKIKLYDIAVKNGTFDPMYGGADVTEDLGVKHIDDFIAQAANGESAGSFPSVVRKTDQERVQNLAEMLHRLYGMSFEITEKVDGKSATYILNEGEFIVCSRNLKIKPTYITQDDPQNQKVSVFWQMANKYGIEEKMRQRGGNFAIQGEIVGPGIQANRLQLLEIKLLIFDVWDIDKQAYLLPDERMKLLESIELDQVTVPVIDESFVLKPGTTSDDLIAMADSPSIVNYNCIREGIVFKALSTVTGSKWMREEQITFKAISNDYLLKYGL